MLNYDINDHLLQNFKENCFQMFTMMHETWIGTKNDQIVTLICVHHSMHSPGAIY
jgi:hypothetical protein